MTATGPAQPPPWPTPWRHAARRRPHGHVRLTGTRQRANVVRVRVAQLCEKKGEQPAGQLHARRPRHAEGLAQVTNDAGALLTVRRPGDGVGKPDEGALQAGGRQGGHRRRHSARRRASRAARCRCTRDAHCGAATAAGRGLLKLFHAMPQRLQHLVLLRDLLLSLRQQGLIHQLPQLLTLLPLLRRAVHGLAAGLAPC